MRVLLLALPAFAAGCSSAVEDGFAELPGFGVLAWLDNDGSPMAYLCGQGDRVSDTSWLNGQGNEVSGAGWTASVKGGTVSVSGDSESFEGEMVPFQSGGLFDAAPDGCRTGLILYGEGADGALSAAGTWCDLEGSFAQVEPIETVIGRLEEVQVQVLRGEDTLQFAMQRIQ